jgi:hypothetical protein
MRKRKPELTCVKVIAWGCGLYGVETQFDDGVCFREPWGTYRDAFRMMEIRCEDIRSAVPRGERNL